MNIKKREAQATHVANPVFVNAVLITGVRAATASLYLMLSDGREYEAPAAMYSRYVPVVGDYLVTQEDGYEYVNPKDVFERKYSPV